MSSYTGIAFLLHLRERTSGNRVFAPFQDEGFVSRYLQAAPELGLQEPLQNFTQGFSFLANELLRLTFDQNLFFILLLCIYRRKG